VRVAARLNRVAVERALFWGLGSALFALAAAASLAGRLSPAAFRQTAVALVVAVVAIATAAWLAARRRWAREVGAARWVEARVPLDERLLTLVTASPAVRESHLWSMLVSDNRAHLGRWAGSRLGIPRVPGNAAYAVLALAAALASLVPRWEPGEPPPEMASTADRDADPSHEVDQPNLAAVGGTLNGGQAGTGDRGDGKHPQGATVVAAIEGMRADLARRFDESIAAAVLNAGTGGGEPPEGGSDDVQLAKRAPNAERGGIGQTKGEAGGRPPDASLARLEQGDGSGQPVLAPEAVGGTGAGKPTRGAGSPDGSAKEGGKGNDQADGGNKAMAGGRGKPDGPTVASKADGEANGGTGGAGAGAGKASAALLAAKPLTLAGGARQTARFALTIGAGTREVGPGDQDGVPTQARSHIADVARGAQAADRSVRHEEIPPEYEAIVKRIFAREP